MHAVLLVNGSEARYPFQMMMAQPLSSLGPNLMYCAVCVLLFAAPADAAVRTWAGTLSGDWHTDGNWVEGAVPNSADDVVVDGNYATGLTIDLTSGSITMASLVIGETMVTEVIVTGTGSGVRVVGVSGNLLIGMFGAVTHPVQGGSQVDVLTLDVGGNVTIAPGGALDVSGRGYAGGGTRLAGSGQGAGSGGFSIGGSGGGHGGLGGASDGSNMPGGVAYGELLIPTTLGSGGGGSDTSWGSGGMGGGAVKLSVSGALVVDGAIRADGRVASVNTSGGGGAGGSIWLLAGSLSGAGQITASGGAGSTYAGRSGGGGSGGRLSLTYDSKTFTGNIFVSGGTGSSTSPVNDGGAGTRLEHDRAAAYGKLTIDNLGRSNNDTPVLEDLTVQTLTLAGGARLILPDTFQVTVLDSSMGGDGTGVFEIESGGLLTADSLETIDGIRLINRGTLNLPAVIAITNSVVTNYGIYNHSSPTLVIDASTTWNEYGTLGSIGDAPAITDIEVRGVLEFGNQSEVAGATFSSLLISDGGVLRHRQNSGGGVAILNLSTATLTIAPGGAIDVSGRGYSGGGTRLAGSGQGGGSGGYEMGGSGGGHGGLGGDSDMPGGVAYGELLTPTTLGSGGGGPEVSWGAGGAGGGSVKLSVSGALVIDGAIHADGRATTANGGGGAGGSIWLLVGSLSGAGEVTATGGAGVASSGQYGGGGSGGRLSLTYDSKTFTGNIFVSGGAGSRTSPVNDGGAGTLFERDRAAPYGKLTIDNLGLSGGRTPLLEDLTVQSLSIVGGAHLLFSDMVNLTLLDSLIGGDGTRTIEIEAGGSLTLDSVQSVDGMRVINRGTLSLPAVSSITNSVVTNYGIYNHSSSTLVIDASTTWYESGLLSTIGDAPVVTDIEVLGDLEFGNQSEVTSAAFDSLSIRSGGVVRHGQNTSTHANSLFMQLGSLLIDAESSINVDGLGYRGGGRGLSGSGLGFGGASSSYGGGGASHGGMGAMGAGSPAGAAGSVLYGSSSEPEELGSGGGGGGSADHPRASGGGAVKLFVSGLAQIEGTISACGARTNPITTVNGGGSGGSIWIDARGLTGVGTIVAKGGAGSLAQFYASAAGGAGGGGRIALYSGLGGFAGTTSVAGGIATLGTLNNGGEGTIHVVERNFPPYAPSLLGPLAFVDGLYTESRNPTLTFEQRDLDEGDLLRYSIQLDDQSDFSTPVIEYISEAMVPGAASFTVGQDAGGGAYVVGTSGESLPSGAYYWRVRSTDMGDAESSYSTANAGAIAFIVNTPPVVNMTAPLSGSVHSALSLVSGTAADSDGSVFSVEVTLWSVGLGKYYDGASFASATPIWLTTSSVTAFARWVFELGGILEDGNDYSVQARVVDSLAQIVEGALVNFTLSSADACIAPRVCHTVDRVSGNGQNGTVGSLLPLPLMVRVTDESGVAASGVVVSWEALSPGASIVTNNDSSDAGGLVWASATLGPEIGLASQLFTATLPGKPESLQFFVATAYEDGPVDAAGITVIIDATPASGSAPALITLDGSRSTASVGASLIDYRWELGDGRVFSGEEATLPPVVYATPGSFGVGLEVRDSFGEHASAKSYITIRAGTSVPPVARIQWERLAPNKLDASFACDCAAGDSEIVAVLWDYGDGDQTDLMEQTHTYPRSGSYRVRLTVQDENGLQGHDSVVIHLDNGALQSPTARIRASTTEGAAPLTVTFTADTYDDDGSVSELQWDFAEQSVTDQEVVVRTFSEPGFYPVRLQAHDNDGLVGRDELLVTVRKGALTPPRIVSVAATEASVGVPYLYDADERPAAQGSRPLYWRLLMMREGQLIVTDDVVEIDPSTGEMNWTPREDQAGEHQFRLEVRNDAGISVEDFTVTVAGQESAEGAAVNAGCGCRSSSSGAITFWMLLTLLLRGLTAPLARKVGSTAESVSATRLSCKGRGRSPRYPLTSPTKSRH